MNLITFFKNIFIGILIGSGAILPGISSGVMLVSLGMYEKLLNTVLTFFKNIKKNFKILFPIVIGCFFGVFLFGNILNKFYIKFPNILKFCFIGLILGSIPSVIKTASKSYKYIEAKNILLAICSFILTILLILIEKNMTNILATTSQFNYFYLILSGFFMSIGIVVPGISSTVILMLLKVYPTYLSAISTVNIGILFPFAIGIILGGFIFMKLIKICFDKFHIQTYYTIIGFSLGSLAVLLPEIGFDFGTFVGILLCCGCYCVSKKI